jgi:hypothetical protein
VAVGGGEGDLGPPHVLLRAVPVRHDRLEAAAVGGLTWRVVPWRMAQDTAAPARVERYECVKPLA